MQAFNVTCLDNRIRRRCWERRVAFSSSACLIPSFYFESLTAKRLTCYCYQPPRHSVEPAAGWLTCAVGPESCSRDWIPSAGTYMVPISMDSVRAAPAARLAVADSLAAGRLGAEHGWSERPRLLICIGEMVRSRQIGARSGWLGGGC